jgi:hypothetical protein
VIAAWAIGRSASASAATVSASKPVWFVPAISIGVIASTLGIGMAIRAAAADRDPPSNTTGLGTEHDVRKTVRRFPPMPRVSATSAPALPALPPGFTRARALSGVPSSPTKTVSLDFEQAPIEDIMRIFANVIDTPIWSTLEPTKVNVRAKDEPALDVLDRLLTDIHATRTEVEAIRIVDHGDSSAASLGGDTMSLSVRAMPLNRVLNVIEPKLAIPIARVGRSFRVVTATGEELDDQSPPVTLELTDVPAGLVLQRALEQTGYGYEPTTGFVITAD